MRRAARRADNEQEIVKALRKADFHTRTCIKCGSKFAPKTIKHIKYCTNKCLYEARKENSVGSKNPNYKNAALRTCVSCNNIFKNYNKTSKYCSSTCYNVHRQSNSKCKNSEENKQRPKLQTKICAYCGAEFRCNRTSKKTTCSSDCALKKRLSKRLYKNCSYCGTQFRYFSSQSRSYCSYECHVNSGGAFRAGLAAAEATMKYGAKKDANHNEIMEVLRKYCAVYDLSNAGCGIPDGVAWINNAWQLFDIKNPKTAYGRRGLNPVQKKWISMWPGGPVYLIYSSEQAERFGQGDFSDIKFFRGGLAPEENADEEKTEELEKTGASRHRRVS